MPHQMGVPLLLFIICRQAHKITCQRPSSESPMQVQRGLRLAFKIKLLVLDSHRSSRDGQRLLRLVLPQLRMPGWKLARRKVSKGGFLKYFHDEVVGAVGALGGSLEWHAN